MLSFFIWAWASAIASSLALALSEVMGVEVPTDPVGVAFADFPPLAAFSARRFCLLAEGAMMFRW
jgi:hypothetical protein